MKHNESIKRAPRVGHVGIHGYFIEGDHARMCDPLLEGRLDEALERFGHLVPRGGRLTGAQWLKAIGQYQGGGESSPYELEVIREIARTMCVDMFPEARVPSDDERLEIARQELSTLGDSQALIRRVDASPADVLYEQTFLELPASHVLRPTPGGLVDRMQSQLMEGLGASDDVEAQLELMLRLVVHHGYSMIVASTDKPLKGWGQQAEGNQIPLNTVENVRESAQRVISNLLDCGWDSQNERNKVFLTRPAPVLGQIASIKGGFETMIHGRLIGWTLPRTLVEGMVARAVSEGAVQSEEMERERV